MDARSAPQWVFPAHSPNQFAQLTADARPPWSTAGFPSPIDSETSAMPPKNRVGLNNTGQTE